jgi:hypothetical protein
MNIFLPFPLAKAFQEKGFTGGLMWYVHGKNLNDDRIFLQYEDDPDVFCYAPTYEQAIAWCESKGFYIELIMDAWGDDNEISAPSYRAFIWEVGKPKPLPYDDLGCGTRLKMLDSAFETILNNMQ